MKIQNALNVIYLISFTDLFAIGIIFPVLNTHLRSLGASHTLVGVFSSVYSGVQVLSGPVVGGWSDIKERKSVLVKVSLICGLCYALLGVTDSLSFIFAIRIVLGCVKHIQSICKAVIADIVPIENQTEAFGKSNAVSALGFILGPFIGGHLAEFENGFMYVGLLTMLLFFINIGLILCLPDVSNKKNDNHNTTEELEKNLFTQVIHELGKSAADMYTIDWNQFYEPFLLRFLFGLSVSTYFTNQSLLLKETYLLTQKQIGYVISYFSTIGLFSSFFLDKINGLYKSGDCLSRIFHFFIILALCILTIYIAPNLYILLVALIPLSFSSTVLRVVTMELILAKTSGLHRGSLSGASNSVMSISRFITPLLSGILADKLGEHSVILVAVIPAIFGVFVSLRLKAMALSEKRVLTN
ncbi:major facilitator superfamily domain-containing protein 9-like [Cylas formicarius]|uniref:major facilitator superfamily domain-containing protein 9-like n=1 Tax=Cylas formicarius TaxID=197179 RepID=UPI002958C26B|nr:major facilitator superfamily domain-containing protein 9-like [Cylas formicarius]XP_060524282.1 major facilitator superfamily domain-containing protein 9-like [Cylas formicarius]XP_060524283.1 major facilitator superfamily domain-containing protein 9-like [Cylas formicarius]XP_060524284.1 major facilitator superfamily domain-containing protein 9-like [Cylas formicarius]